MLSLSHTVGIVPIFLALPCGVGANAFNATVVQSCTHCDSFGYGGALCKESITAAAMEDAEFLHMIQVRFEVQQRGHISLKMNRNDQAATNGTIVATLQQNMDAQLLAQHFIFKFRTAMNTWSNTYALGGKVVFYCLLVVLIVLVIFCVFLKYLWSLEKYTEKQEGPFEDRAQEGGAQKSKQESMQQTAPTKTFKPGDIPVLCPQLIMPNVTRLALPVEPLNSTEFDVDVLALSGMPQLRLFIGGGDCSLRISLATIGTLISTVTPARHVLGPKSVHVGTLMANGPKRYALRDRFGRTILMVYDPGDGKVHMFRECNGQTIELALMQRFKATEHGRLPKEHYEVTINPENDPVLVLASFLALMLFTLPA